MIRLPSYWSMPADHEIEPLSLEHVMLSFILCLVGLGLATVAFVLENVHFKFKTQKTESVKSKVRSK